MKPYTLWTALLTALALLTATTACSPATPAASPDDTPPVSLDGTSWTLIALNGQDLLSGTEITLDVDGDQLSGTAGCNRYFGTLTTNADGTTTVGGVGSTEMWCAAPEGVMDQETSYLQALRAAVRYSVEDDTLTLFGADGQALLVYVPQTEPVDEGSAVETGTGTTDVYVDAIDLQVMESFPVQVAALVRGSLSNGCVVLDGASAVRTDEGFRIEIETHREGDVCAQALVPFEERVTLDVLGLPAGTYVVRAGEVVSEFTFTVDNEPVDGPSADGAREQYVQDLRGTVTGIEIGADGLQVELTVPQDQGAEDVYSVTISVMQAEVFGRWEGIQQGAELVVSGPILQGMTPTLIVAEKVTVVESRSDYVRNLHGTVTSVTPGPAGLRAEIRANDGTHYRVTLDPATTEIVYLGEKTEIQVGAPVRVSGELFCLMETRIAADVAMVL